eukprot:8899038-Pyramimonas_sp.AAC.1
MHSLRTIHGITPHGSGWCAEYLIGHRQQHRPHWCATAQTSERVPRPRGHGIKQLDLTKRLHVSGVGHGAAVCGKSVHCRIACKDRGDSAGTPAIARLDTRPVWPRDMARISLQSWALGGHEKMVIPGTDIHRLLR